MTGDRSKYIGGSDVASIFGLSPWKTPYDLYLEKTEGEVLPPDAEREKILRRGKKLEPVVLEMLKEEHGIVPVYRNQRYTDKELEFVQAEIDFGAETWNGEIKTVSPFAAQDWGAQQTDQIPLAYCLQVMYGLMVTGCKEAIVAALIGADDLRLYRVGWDEELAQEIRKRVVQFWKGHVIPRVPPEPQNVRDIHRMLYRYGGFEVPMDEKIAQSLKSLRDVKEAAKELSEMQKKYELELKRELLVRAEAAGITDTPKKFTITDMTGKRTASLSYEHRKGYVVGETDFWILRT